jgi:hypothetical protein
MSTKLLALLCVVLLVICLLWNAAVAQQVAPPQTAGAAPQVPSKENSEPPTARPADVDTLEHILFAVYDCISGPAGPRDWNRVRSLFYPNARLIPARRDENGKATAHSLSIEDYIGRAQPVFAKQGFYESAVANRVEQWDRIAHVWSTYESRHAPGENPFARGVNSFQFMFDGTRWWVLTAYWEGEDPAHPLPEKYLK